VTRTTSIARAKNFFSEDEDGRPPSREFYRAATVCSLTTEAVERARAPSANCSKPTLRRSRYLPRHCSRAPRDDARPKDTMADDKKVRRRMIRLSVVDSSPGASLCALGPPEQPRSRETAARLRTDGRKRASSRVSFARSGDASTLARASSRARPLTPD